MIKRDTRPSSAEGTRRPAKLTAVRLDKLIEEATVDCYNDSEQLSGLYTIIEGNL